MIAEDAVPRDPSQAIRVLIVDDRSLARQGLRALLETHGFRVLAEVEPNAYGMSEAARLQPDIILLDFGEPHRSRTDFLRRLASLPARRVIVLAGTTGQETLRLAVSGGAAGIVDKREGAAALFRAIEQVHAGEARLKCGAGVVADLPRRHPPDGEQSRIAGLTSSEREIIMVLCQGLKNRQIAERLFVSEAAVRGHLASILTKLELGDRFELTLFAYRHQLGKSPPFRSS